MFLRAYILTIFTVNVALAADHNVFKNCSEINLCNEFRKKEPYNLYGADLDSLTLENNIVTLNLTISEGKLLQLKICVLLDDNFRVLIEEPDSTRYHLEHVLNVEPEIANIEVNAENNLIKLSGNNTKAIIYSTPLIIEFYKNDELEIIFNGSRLLFEESSNVFTFKINYPLANTFYGLHEHAVRLPLQNTKPNGMDPYRLRNLDVSEFELNTPMALYGSIPVLYGHGLAATAGFFLHNTAEQWYELNSSNQGSEAYLIVESGVLDLFILLGSSPKELVRQYTRLTGVAHLPQLWTLGYHQCRWNYDNQSDVKNVIANFDKYDFPVDAIWLDIEYTNGKRYFTWDPEKFSDPVEMQQNLSTTNRKLVTIIDPHIKVDSNYELYSGALEQNFFVKYPNGTVFEGNSWPGLSSYIDFLNPNARDYYGSFYNYSKFPSTTETLAGIWNDMNEPTVSDNENEKTLTGDIVHYGNVSHRDIHNIYGLLHTMSTHSGLLARDPRKRPFVLTRAHFAGSQRYASIWTGDNNADWNYLAIGIAQCLNANILGLVFCGSDIGGFYNNPSDELLQRFYQAGAWIPFYREHSTGNTPRREPYLYSDEVQTVLRNAIRQRYEHLHVFYTLFYEHTRYGDPIIRPLFYQYSTENEVIDIDKEFLVGNDILVAPVLQSSLPFVSVYVPGNTERWLEIHTLRQYSGGQWIGVNTDINFIPVFYRMGSIIPKKLTARPNTEEMKADPFTITINTDKHGNANGTVYIDDFESFDYQSGVYNYWNLTYTNNSLSIESIDGSGNFQFTIENIVINHFSENTDISKTTVHNTTKEGIRMKDLVMNLRKNVTIIF